MNNRTDHTSWASFRSFPGGPISLLGLFVFFLASSWSLPEAHAGFRLCNKTGNRIGISIGYQPPGSKEWLTEGWWNISPDQCKNILNGALIARYYYLHAIDYDEGGIWSGKAFMCTRNKEFEIKGIHDCIARGFERTGFYEIDTGGEPHWTVQLTKPTQKRSKYR